MEQRVRNKEQKQACSFAFHLTPLSQQSAQKNLLSIIILSIFASPSKTRAKKNERRYFNVMIIINIKDGESLDKALKRFKKKFEKTGVLRELRSRQAYEKKSVTRRTEIKHAVYIQNLNQEGTL